MLLWPGQSAAVEGSLTWWSNFQLHAMTKRPVVAPWAPVSWQRGTVVFPPKAVLACMQAHSCQCCRYDVLSWKFPDWAATPGPAFNILKGGIVAADRVLTVSQVSQEVPNT